MFPMFHAAALLAQTSPAPAPPCDTKSCKPEAEILGNETQAFGSGCQAPGSGSDLPVWQRKVTLVTTGATDADDGNFNSLAISGAMAACTVENQCCLEVDMPHGTDTDYFCELLYAADDSHLVIGVGHLHAQAVAHAAGCVANKRFAAIDVEFASHPNKNLEGFIFRDAQAGFMAGMIAGMVAKLGTKKVGIAAGPGIPPVARFTTGFTNGVAHADACPECSSTLVSCEFAHMGAGNEFPDCGNAFACPACGIKRVQTLLAAGVDVIFSAGGMTGAAGLKYAAAPKGTVVFGVEKTEVATAYVVGVDADEWVTQFDKGLAPGAEKIITSAMKNVDIAVKQAIANYMVGLADGRNYILNAANGGMGFAPCHDACAPKGPVTTAMTDMVRAVESQLKEGSFDTGVDSMGKCTKAGAGLGCPVDNTPMIVGIVAGCVGALILLLCVLLLCMCKREKEGKPIFKPVGSGGTPGVQISTNAA